MLVRRTDRALVRRTDGVLVEELDGQLLLLRPGSDQVLQLNGTASAVWEALEPGRTLAQVAGSLAPGLGVAPEVLLADLEPVLAVLLQHGLVSVDE